MSDYRIVFNEQTGRYRVERRSWWSWDFVYDASGEGYATFDSLQQAREFVCREHGKAAPAHRRWRVVDPCCEAMQTR